MACLCAQPSARLTAGASRARSSQARPSASRTAYRPRAPRTARNAASVRANPHCVRDRRLQSALLFFVACAKPPRAGHSHTRAAAQPARTQVPRSRSAAAAARACTARPASSTWPRTPRAGRSACSVRPARSTPTATRARRRVAADHPRRRGVRRLPVPRLQLIPSARLEAQPPGLLAPTSGDCDMIYCGKRLLGNHPPQ